MKQLELSGTFGKQLTATVIALALDRNTGVVGNSLNQYTQRFDVGLIFANDAVQDQLP